MKWIKEHFADSTRVLSVCDGATTAAATGLYDGKQLTAHATDYQKIKKDFPRPIWVQQVSYTQSGNLFSTAGVSNAVEGSLAVIRDLFGAGVMKSVMRKIKYHSSDLDAAHNSIAVNAKAVIAGFKKVVFSENKQVGILLQDGMSEFDLAAIFDTYNRTLPSSIKAYVLGGTTVKSGFGLTLVATDSNWQRIDEMHVLRPDLLNKSEISQLRQIETVPYKASGRYIFNDCLTRVKTEYGGGFQHLVKLALDYN